MKAATVNEIKQALKTMESNQLAELCLRLARFKKENKELLTFLLFEEDDLDVYLKNVKEEMDRGFAEMNTTNIYFIKKTVRKVLRMTNKYIRYTSNKSAEVELLLHYCLSFGALKIPVLKSTALMNLYKSQVKKIETSIGVLHEDLQHDYLRELKKL